MLINNLSNQTSVFTQVLAELRDIEVQKDRQRFRFNLERAAEILAFELSKSLQYEIVTVNTPLGAADAAVLAKQPVLVCILRAGMPFLNGFLRVFDKAESAFVSAYRKYTIGNEFVINVEYVSCPDLTNKPVIFLDPMMATGKSMVCAYQELIKFGLPEQIYIVSLIASEEAVEYLQRQVPKAKIFVGAIDSELTAKSYIVPGLGDAGDLAFGEKL